MKRRDIGGADAAPSSPRAVQCVDTLAAAALLCVSPQTLYNWAALGSGPKRIKTSRRGKTLYRVADLLAWQDARTVLPTDVVRVDTRKFNAAWQPQAKEKN